MIKKLLLKLAHKIYKHYNTIEIKYTDLVKFNDEYYRIVKLEISKEIGCVDVLRIELHDVLENLKYKYKKYNK